MIRTSLSKVKLVILVGGIYYYVVENMSIPGVGPPEDTTINNQSMAAVFWTHIGRNEPSVAEEVARRVAPPFH